MTDEPDKFEYHQIDVVVAVGSNPIHLTNAEILSGECARLNERRINELTEMIFWNITK